MGLVASSLLLASFGAGAQTVASSTDPTIIEHITEGTENIVIIPQNIQSLLEKQEQSETTDGDKRKATDTRTRVFRIQVYTDNGNINKNAKAEAQRRATAIRRRFPQQYVNSSYASPRWYTRVGSFSTRAEADEFMRQLAKAFPAYAREMSIVQERVKR